MLKRIDMARIFSRNFLIIILLLFLFYSSPPPAYAGASFEAVNDLWVTNNTGLGITAPLGRLHIQGAGTSAAFALRIADSTPTDRLVVLDNGNVGIGLTNPAAKLDVSGQVKITGGSPGSSKVLTSDANGLATWAAAASGNGWTASGTNVYVTTTTDNVGIGNTAPIALLQAGSSPTLGLVVTAAGNVGIGNTLPVALLQIGTSPTPQLYITAAGNVGIGNTSPLALLQVGTSPKPGLVVTVGGRVGIGTTSPASFAFLDITGDIKVEGTIPQYIFRESDATVDNKEWRILADNEQLAFVAEDDAGTTNQSFMTVDRTTTVIDTTVFPQGNVGIGVTPTAKLHIRGSGTTAGFALRIADSIPTDRLVVLDNGNVGIAITLPVALLEVGTHPVPGLLVTAAGNVGIGNTNPVALLQAGTSPNPGLVVLANGNVGIGTTAPAAKFEIIPADTTASGGLYINLAASKVVMKSADGTCSACGPDNADAWACASVTCP